MADPRRSPCGRPTTASLRPGRPLRPLPLAARVRRFGSVAAILAAGACGGEPPPFLVEARVSPTPATVGRARVLVEVRDPAGAPVEGARVRVRPVDPAGEAGAAVEAEPGAPGLWVADPVSLPRPGDWTLELEVTGPDGAVVVRDAPLHVVGPPGGGR